MNQENFKFVFPMENKDLPEVSSADPQIRFLHIGFISLTLLMIVFYSNTEWFKTFSIIFVSITLEATPFMLLGTIIGGLLEVFLPREKISDFVPKNRVMAIIAAALLGIVFPVCECAIVPVVKKLLEKGMPLGSAIAFLLAGPIVNPMVFASTFVAYSFTFKTALVRFIGGFVISVIVALIVDKMIKREEALLENVEYKGCDCCFFGEEEYHSNRIAKALYHGMCDFYEITRFLVIGAFIAALIQTFVPRQLFFIVMDYPLISITLMMFLAVILNLCSEADAFIAASFVPLGLSFPAQLSFLITGPMLDIKLVLMYLGVFRKKMIILLAVSILSIIFISMLILEVLTKWIM